MVCGGGVSVRENMGRECMCARVCVCVRVCLYLYVCIGMCMRRFCCLYSRAWFCLARKQRCRAEESPVHASAWLILIDHNVPLPLLPHPTACFFTLMATTLLFAVGHSPA